MTEQLLFPKLSDSTLPGRHRIDVRMTSKQGAMRNFRSSFRIRSSNRIVMIQTDKPVYQPGQTSKIILSESNDDICV